MSVAKRRFPTFVRVARPKLFVLLAAFLVATAVSWTSLLIQPEAASALTQTQKDFCLANFGDGKLVKGVNNQWATGWKENSCDQVCTTKTTVGARGVSQIKSTGCNAAAAVSTSPDTKTNDILRAKYGDAAAKSICGANSTDQTCLRNVRTAAENCVDAYINNGYDDPNAPVYPKVNTDTLSDCIANKLSLSNNRAVTSALKDDLKNAEPAITKEASASSDQTTKKLCEDVQGKWDEATKSCDTTSDTEGKADCSPEIGAVGWLICPVMNLMASINDKMYDLIAKMLAFNPTILKVGTATTTTNSNEYTYAAWNIFRSYANVAFVIVFLLIIISQISSIGISNYGIKRMLPKLVIAALLVNLSFFICQILVDVSNVLGFGLKSLFDGIATSVQNSNTSGGSWTGITAAVLSFGAVGVGVGGVALATQGIGLLALLAPVILAAFLALCVIVLILVGRWAAIILLIVVSPIAFVAYILPNTESWFKKWWKMLWTMLMLFPIVSVVFGACALASVIIAQLGEGWPIVALGISAIPLIVVPGLLKGALEATGAVGAKIKGIGDRATRNVGKTANKQYEKSNYAQARKIRKAGEEQYRRSRFAERVANRGPMGGIAITPAQRAGKARLNQAAKAMVDEDFEKDVKAAGLDFATESSGDVMGQLFDDKGNISTKLNEAQRSAAISHVMAKGSFDERRKLVEATGQMSAGERKRVGDGVFAKGDQNIYGTSVGAKIANGSINGEDDLRKQTLANIENGSVSAEQLVQGESSASYLVDVAKGETTQVGADGKAVIDPTTKRKVKVAYAGPTGGSTLAQSEIKKSAKKAQNTSGTTAKAAASAMAHEIGRV